MKRCPECQFLYENESTTCDLDGTPLRYTVKLPAVPGLAESIWDKWTIALVFAVVLATVLVILYRATPRAYTSAAQTKPVKNEMPAASQDPPSTDSAASPESTAPQPAVDDSDSSTDSRDPFEAPAGAAGTKAPKSKRGLQAADEKEPPPAPVIHVEAPPNPAGIKSTNTAPIATTPAETSANTVQKPAPSASATSNHPLPPAAPANKANTPGEKKESGFKSLLKKAGKVLKKPFGEN
jgi:hypothetical protein